VAEDFGARIYTPHVAQEARPEPYASEEALVAVSREAVGIGGRVKRPGLFTDRSLGDVFEVVSVDDGFKTGLLVEFEFCGFLWRRLCPFICDCSCINGAFQL
jgi:hypothetical protein